MNRLFYLNALFDLNLGQYPVQKLSRSAREMTSLFAFMGDQNDRILLDIEFPQDYLRYLNSIGISPLKQFDNIWAEEPFEAVPWGWDSFTLERLTKTGAHCNSPDLNVVKYVNSRKYHQSIASKLGLGVPDSNYCDTPQSFLTSIKEAETYPLVVKPSFGGSGFGFRIIENIEQGTQLCKSLQSVFDHGGLILEPWYQRVHDFSSSVTINNKGSVTSIRHQRSISNMHGAFVGIYMAPNDPVLAEFATAQERIVYKVAEALASEGYFGPAGFDSFSYKDRNGDQKSAFVIEINARLSMSDVAFSIKNNYAADKYCFFRLLNLRRCTLPDTYNRWLNLIKNDHFNPKTKKGVILATPLRIIQDNVWVQPMRNAFFIAADSEKELFDCDSRLKNLLENSGSN